MHVGVQWTQRLSGPSTRPARLDLASISTNLGVDSTQRPLHGSPLTRVPLLSAASSSFGGCQRNGAHMSDASRDRMLPGENPDTERLDDAELWIQVYRELIAVKHDLIATLVGHMGGLSEPVQAELNTDDYVLLRDQAAGFERRQQFWEPRTLEPEKHASGVREDGEAPAPESGQ